MLGNFQYVNFFALSFMTEVILADAFDGERFELLIDVVLLILFGFKLKLWLYLLQFDWSLELGPLHGPNYLVWLVFHGWSFVHRTSNVKTFDGVVVEWVLIAAKPLLLTTPARKRVRSTWAIVKVVICIYLNLIWDNFDLYFALLGLLYGLSIHAWMHWVRTKIVVVPTSIISFDLFSRKLEIFAIILDWPSLIVIFDRMFRFLLTLYIHGSLAVFQLRLWATKVSSLLQHVTLRSLLFFFGHIRTIDLNLDWRGVGLGWSIRFPLLRTWQLFRRLWLFFVSSLRFPGWIDYFDIIKVIDGSLILDLLSLLCNRLTTDRMLHL